jgi:hypothetical protein
MVVSPAGAAPRTKSLPVQRCGYCTQRAPLLAQTSYLGHRRLLARIRLHVLAVRRNAVAVRQVADALSVRAFVLDRVPRALGPPDTGSEEGIAGETGGQTDNGEEKPHAET